MLKFLLILSIIGYLVYKVGSFFFRVGAASNERFRQRNENPNVHKGTGKKSKEFKGGEYIDYEEVK